MVSVDGSSYWGFGMGFSAKNTEPFPGGRSVARLHATTDGGTDNMFLSPTDLELADTSGSLYYETLEVNGTSRALCDLRGYSFWR
jgi:hypothetical protein